MNKSEFIAAMEAQLLRLSKSDRDDILNDYESHFVNGVAEGRTEEEVSAQLGDPVELAAVYLENLPESAKGAPYIPEPETKPEPEANSAYYRTSAPSYDAPAGNTYTAGQQTYAAPSAAAEPNTGGIVAVVLISIFVALPVLWCIAGLIMGAFGVSIVCVAACASLITLGATTAAWGAMTATGFILIGVAMIAMCVLSISLGILGIKGTIQLVKWYIELCKKMIGGSK